MRVVVASKFWYRRGGLERVMFDEIAGVEAHGVEVAHFSTAHPLNVTSPWSDYFAPYLELGGDGSLSAAEKVTAVARMFANRVAARKFGSLLDAVRPDVVHIHGIHRQLSPSILFAARRRGVPVVQTLHDAHHVCPADVLLRGGTTVCDPRRCGVYSYTPALANRCVRGSATASAISAAETTFQRARRAYERTVSRFISPSRYMAGVMEAGGWTGIPIDVVPNGVPVPATISREPGDYFLVSGRLSEEKGVAVVLQAARLSGQRVIVAGEGPLADELRLGFPEAEFLGHVNRAAIDALLDRATAAVVPSLAPENAPMSVIEAMARGVPVIASRAGGLPEIVDSASGILVRPGDVNGVAAAMRAMASDPESVEGMGCSAFGRASVEFSLERHVRLILDVYERCMASAGETR